MAYNYLAAPDAELAPMLESLSGPKLPHGFIKSDINAYRAMIQDFGKSVSKSESPTPPDSLVVAGHSVTVEEGSILVRTYRPMDPLDAKLPLVVWTHGGGLVFGNLDSSDGVCRVLAHDLKLSVVNVEYRLAPEFPHPIPLDDSYTALKWAVKNSDALAADLSKGVIVGGTSAGAYLAAAMAQRALADPFFAAHGTKVSGQVLQIPMLCHPDALPESANLTSYEQNAEAPMLSTNTMREIYGGWTVPGNPSDPELSPLLRPSLEGLAPVYMQVTGLDPLRDTGLVYAERLREANVPLKLDLYPGAPHGFHVAFSQTKLAQRWARERMEGVRWLLAQGNA
ncbi:Alpha/Beta hydrolase protein [Epithele typhae]|uniref:Alpha/Beta hydrolase protein n=1 Tax=Epithele typhae TaxID=378194 RepID=UPI0020078556|nr:Alpha/Beta hydrolase protein [Epithele typhae]KAH9941749.1 Alpha/Beta hydrolase protein [Epithele typhae]